MKSDILLLVGVGVAAALMLKKSTDNNERQALISWANSLPSGADRDAGLNAFNSMTDQEIHDTYTMVFYYDTETKLASMPADLRARLQAIAYKYNIFG